MPLLSLSSNRRLCIALAKQDDGNEVASNLNSASLLADQSGLSLVSVIVATNVSQTIDFAALAKGDKVVHISVAGGNNDIVASVATAGTLGEAAIVGDVYVVMRPFVAPAAAAFSF